LNDLVRRAGNLLYGDNLLLMDKDLVSSIRERYQRVLGLIAEAVSRRRPELVEGSGRGAEAVRLITVTKMQPVEVLQAALEAGITVFGENYAEEAVQKISALKNSGVEWHMIGHVQSRKAGLVAANFSMMHSLDSLKLAERLDRFCAEQGRTLPVLVEVNVSGEESKSGFLAWDEHAWPDLTPVLAQLTEFSHLHVRGLMTMPPYFDDPERTRPYFQRMRHLQEYLTAHLPALDWTELSMGTSSDFVAAVEEGATYVRVGQAILGPRPA
jgi:PLP dependent protein